MLYTFPHAGVLFNEVREAGGVGPEKSPSKGCVLSNQQLLRLLSLFH